MLQQVVKFWNPPVPVGQDISVSREVPAHTVGMHKIFKNWFRMKISILVIWHTCVRMIFVIIYLIFFIANPSLNTIRKVRNFLSIKTLKHLWKWKKPNICNRFKNDTPIEKWIYIYKISMRFVISVLIIIGAVVGSVCLLVTTAGILVLCICKNQRKEKDRSRHGIDNPAITPVRLLTLSCIEYIHSEICAFLQWIIASFIQRFLWKILKNFCFLIFRTTFIITADFIMRMTATWAVRFMADDGIQGITKWRQMAHGTNSQWAT